MCKFVCFEIMSRFGRIFALVTGTRLFATVCKFVCFEILSRFGRIFTLVTGTRLFATVS